MPDLEMIPEEMDEATDGDNASADRDGNDTDVPPPPRPCEPNDSKVKIRNTFVSKADLKRVLRYLFRSLLSEIDEFFT